MLKIFEWKLTYFGLLHNFPTYFLLISFKITTFLLLLSSNIGKVAELWTLGLLYSLFIQCSVQCYILMDKEWSQNIQNTDTVLERSCSVIPPRAPCEEGGTVIIIMFCHLYLLLPTDLTITQVQTPGGRRRTVCRLQIAMQRWMSTFIQYS